MNGLFCLKIIVIAGRHTKDWLPTARLLIERGHAVKVICPSNDNPSIKTLTDENLQVRLIEIPRPGIPIFTLASSIHSTVAGLYRIFQRERPDLVFSYTFPLNIWARLASWWLGVPIRACKLNGPAVFLNPWFAALELGTAWMDNVVLASSRMLARAYRRGPGMKGKVHLNYFGFKLRDFSVEKGGEAIRQEFGISGEAPLVVMIALMYRPRRWLFEGANIKGHDVLLHAARILREQNPAVRFLIVGDDALPGLGLRIELERLKDRLGLQNNVVFTGFRKDIPDILDAADVVAVPSLIENVGGAIEPLWMRKPVVASNVGGLPDVVKDFETGLLVPPGDPEALARGLLEILALSPGQREQMGARGHEIIGALFDLEKVTDEMERLFLQKAGKQKKSYA